MITVEQSIAMNELERETAETLTGEKRFVMFDEDKSRSASLEDIKDLILGEADVLLEDHEREIQAINAQLTTFADELEVDDEGLVWLLNNGEPIAGPYGPFAGGGGGGGSSNNAILTLMNTSGWLQKTIAEGASCSVSFVWSSTEDDIPTGDGILTVRVNGSVRVNKTITQGEAEIDISSYLSSGTNMIRITIADVYSNTKSINYTISVMTLSIKSSFDASIARTGSFTYSYTPIGNIEKKVYFIIDGVQIGEPEITSISGKQLSRTIPMQSHGAHSFLVYFESEVNGDIIKSNELYYDLICVDPSSTIPIIASNFRETTVEQYTTIKIPYTVYNPNNIQSEVQLYVNDNLVSTQIVGNTEKIWSYRVGTVGSFVFKIQTGSIYREFNLTVVKSAVIAEVTTEDMVLGLQSTGRSNAEQNPGTWVYENIRCIFENFNYVSNGWVSDADGNTVLRINGNARLTIPYKPFATDFRSTGKTIEIDFATKDVLNYDAIIMSCMSGNRGFSLTTQKAMLKSEQSEVSTQYKEDEHVRISFVIEKRSETYPLLFIYINGIMSGVVQYPSTDDFTQLSPVNITVGTNECTTDIYCIRIYDNNLTRNQILENWIADTQDIDLMLERYERNDVYDAYGAIVTSKLPNDLPYLILTGSQLPQFKGDKKTIDGTYVDPSNPSKSFTFTGAQIDVQGTSSQFYARKNYKIKFNNGFDMTQSEEHITKYGINDGIPTKTFTFKADVASSEGANNVELVRLYNQTCPYKTPPQRVTDSKVRQGIDGFPIVMFWDDGNTTSFLGKYNWNNDKGTEEIFGFTDGDESWETLNNSGSYALWKSADYTGTGWLSDYEARYPDPDDKDQDPTNLAALAAWVVTTNQATATNIALSEPYTDDTGVVHTIDNVAYRIAKFHTEAPDHFEMDSLLFMYLFTELFLMVDSRAKNAFPSFLGGDKWCFLPYDMDTAIGIDNRGELTFGYSLEDTDYIGSMPVFNGQDSVLWINVRDAFRTELENMYQQVRGSGTNQISYDKIESMFEEHQSKWPEAIFNEDAWFKYIDPLLNDGNGDYLSMALGSKAEQRKWWLYNRFRYMDSKYLAGNILTDTIEIRPGAIDSGITITPYADIYAAVRWDNDTHAAQERTMHGTSVTIPCPYEQVGDNVIHILNASQLADVGDLSGFKPHRAVFSNAVRLQSVKVGSNTAGYTNPNLKDLTFGNNFLLKTVDARNCIALNGNINLSGATNIEEIYFENTIITGVTLPNGGILKTLHLPESITNLTILNQPYITDFSLASYNNISTLRLENVPTLDIRNILNYTPNTAKIRLVGFTWEVESTEEIDALFSKFDSMAGGLDESGNDTSTSQAIQGTIHISYLKGDRIAAYHARYPYVTIDADSMDCVVTYLNAVGGIDYQETVYNGEHARYAGQPSKSSTTQYTYTWIGWSERDDNIVNPDAQKFITMDKTLYPCYSETLKAYTIVFKTGPEDGNETLYTQYNVLYGETPVYNGPTPVSSKDTDPTNIKWPFYGWSPALSPATGNTTYTAIFKDTSPITRVLVARRPLEASGTMSFIGSYAFGYCTQLDTIDFPNVTYISNSAFYNCTSLTSINLPNVIHIGSYAFGYCSNLKNISFSQVTSIGSGAFAGCRNLTTVDLPLLESIPQSAFAYCGSPTLNLPNVNFIGYYGFWYCNFSTVTLSNVTEIDGYGFYMCQSLGAIDFPNVVSINYSAFMNCIRLSSVNLPKVTFIGGEAFSNCTNLTEIELPSLRVLGRGVFSSCSNLVTASFKALTSIGSNAFCDCYYLRSIYLLAPSVVDLANINAFTNTMISVSRGGVYGSIYVPSSMVREYQKDTRWTTYSERITAYID